MKIYVVGAAMSLLLAVQADLARGAPGIETEVVLTEEDQLRSVWDLQVMPELPILTGEFLYETDFESRFCTPGPRMQGVKLWRDRHTGARYRVRGLLNSKRPHYLRQKRPG